MCLIVIFTSLKMTVLKTEIPRVYYKKSDLVKRYGIVWSTLYYYIGFFSLKADRRGDGRLKILYFPKKVVDDLDYIIEMKAEGYTLSAIRRKLEEKKY